MCLIMSVIIDQVGRHKVLLPINHTYNKIFIFYAFLKLKHKKFPSS